jgi:ribosomal-protein-serine acetyltransferase
MRLLSVPVAHNLPDLDTTELHNAQLLLRPPRDEDIAPLYQAALESVAEIRPWLAWYHDHYSMDDTALWINNVPAAWQADREYSFAIIDRQDNQLLGTIGINQLDRRNLRANLGYFVRTSATNRGIATAATRLLARFGFERLYLRRIEIVAAVGNYASQKVAHKLGATREGVARRRSHVGDQQLDTVMFSLIAEDWQRGQLD